MRTDHTLLFSPPVICLRPDFWHLLLRIPLPHVKKNTLQTSWIIFLFDCIPLKRDLFLSSANAGELTPKTANSRQIRKLPYNTFAGQFMKHITIAGMVATCAIMAACSRRSSSEPLPTVWPEITSTEQLRSDASVLLNTYRVEAVASNAWPDSVSALAPRWVYVGRGAVYLVVSPVGGFWPGEGYLVFPDPRTEADEDAAGFPVEIVDRIEAGVFRARTPKP